MSVMVNMDSTNDTSGAGAIDSWHSVATTIDQLKNAHGAQAAALGVELGIGVVSAVADTVALALDPFAKLISAGLGWLIEHVSFLKAPLDQLLGNPQGVSALAEALHKTAEKLRNTAKDMGDSLDKTITSWKGNAYDTFKNQATALQGQIDNAGHAVDVAGYMMDTTGAVIAAVRNLVRDMITTVLGDIIATVLIGLSLAPITFGASLVASVAKAVVDAVETVAKAAKVLKAVTTFGKGASQTSHDLSTVLKDLPRIPKAAAGTGARPAPAPRPGAGSETGGAHGAGASTPSSSGAGGHDTAPSSTTPTGPGHEEAGTGGSGNPVSGNTAPGSTKPSGVPEESPGGSSSTSNGAGSGKTAPGSTKPSDTPEETPGGSSSTSNGAGSSKTAPAGTKPSDNGEEGNGFHDDGGDNSAYHTWQQWDKQHPDGTPGGGSTGGAGHESGTPGGQNTGHQDGEGGTTNPSGHQNTDDGTTNPNDHQNNQQNNNGQQNNGHQNNGNQDNGNQDNAGHQNDGQNTGGQHNTDGNPPAPPAKQDAKDSKLKSSELPQMKKHEDWLKNEQKGPDGKKLPPSKDPFREQLADFWNGTNKTGANKFGQSEAGKENGEFGMGTKGWENWLKDKNRPEWVKDAYPWLKGISDAKSSKTSWGMIDKTIVNLDKSLTPIQEHADQGWQEADQENQGDNPNGNGG